MGVLRTLLGGIDEVLRGRYTPDREVIPEGTELRARHLIVAGVALGAIYGLFMGLYGVTRPTHATYQQTLASMAKVPLLFLLTLVVTFPSLYVFSALGNTRLRFRGILNLLLAGIAVNLTVLASFAPVTGFFTLSTESYPFMVVLNVVFFTVSGIVSLAFVWKGLTRVFSPPTPSGLAAGSGAPGEDTTPATAGPRTSRANAQSVAGAPDVAKPVFFVWIFIYGAVGAQMGWILRPFIGTPGSPFELFRERESNFFEAVLRSLARLLS